MKILPPTLREKKRYLALQIISETRASRNQFLKELQYSIASLVGDVGLSESRLQLLYFDGRFAIVRCVPKKIWVVRAGIAAITGINKRRIAVRVIGIGGTVRSVTEKYKDKKNCTFS